MALSPLLDPLIRLRLRASTRRLGQRTQDAAPRQLDLEVVVAEAARVPQHGLSCTQEIFARGRRSVELRLGLTVAPRLVRDAAERQTRLLDRVALDLRRIAGQAMEFGKRNAALAVFAGCQHARLEGGERDAHVRGMRGDAVLARPQDRVHPIDPFDRRTAAARLALIAWRGRIVEIEAARSLQEIAPGGCHVPQLLRGAGKNRTAEQWIACLDARVIDEIAIGHQRGDPQAAVPRLLDLVERKMGDVDQPRWARDILLHEIDQVGAPSDEFCARVRRNLAHGVGDVARARISEIVHRFASADFSMALPNMTSSMAATMLG